LVLGESLEGHVFISKFRYALGTLVVQGGGNAGNALTCVARLGLNPRLISKVANDAQGKSILEELESDGVDTSFFIVSEEGNSPFTYIIVDNETKTRTCIHTPGYPPLIPDELSQSQLLSALDGANMVYFDGRLYETALIIAKEAACKNIPILVDAEREREGLDDLLNFASYAICSARFPQAWTKAPSLPSALLSMLLRLPNLKFVIVTLGQDGCIMLERSVFSTMFAGGSDAEETDIHGLLESLKQRKDESKTIPTCISSVVTILSANGIGTVFGRLFIGTAEKIPPSELVDTTGAGDAFIGAVVYGTFIPSDLISLQLLFSERLNIFMFNLKVARNRLHLAVGLWEPERVFHTEQIHAWRPSCDMSTMLEVMVPERSYESHIDRVLEFD
ncbi:hypothetical protein Goari_011157, partial [Gossypium aridum]|nr:hypothetical protein [Gossypium aridum]